MIYFFYGEIILEFIVLNLTYSSDYSGNPMRTWIQYDVIIFTMMPEDFKEALGDEIVGHN